MGRDRKTIYYAPFDHHLNANSLITAGANCYVLCSVIRLATNRANHENVFYLQRMLPMQRMDAQKEHERGAKHVVISKEIMKQREKQQNN